MENTGNADKLDYLPVEIINCLTTEKPYPISDRDNLLPKIRKKKTTTSEIKLPKLPKYYDITSIRGEEIDKLKVIECIPPTESIIPSKYWIIKEDLRRFIEYSDRELESLEEIGQRQVVFPTERPNGRHEVKCLDITLRRILDDDQRPDAEFSSLRIRSRDDIDSLLQCVVRQEQIYNIILHELGRQVMTSSSEAGSTIMELRKMYTELVNQIPDELLRLKDEVKEQVMRDSKLLTQIEDFQAAIIYLTDHLKEVKNQDIKVTKDADTLQKELEAAMQDSTRSKEILNEYHVLYDLQRQRLDKQMSSINIEKEEWSSLAFALSLKISDESLLTSTKRMRLITKKLIQLSQHFAIFISDCDTVITAKIQDISDQYLKTLTRLHTSTNKLVNNFFDLFHFLRTKFESFAKREITEPRTQLQDVLNQIMSLNGFLGDEVLKKFMLEISSENTINYETDVVAMNTLAVELKGLINELADRQGFLADKNSEEGIPLNDFNEMYGSINEWSEIISSKLRLMSNFQYFFLDFQSKVSKIETEISGILDADKNTEEDHSGTEVESVMLLISELYIETFEAQEFGVMEKNEDFTNFNKFHNDLQKSMTTFSTKIDGFDASMMESINKHQDMITHWIVDIIFLVSNMSETNELEIKYKQVCATFAQVIKLNGSLYDYVTRYTEKFIASSASEMASRQMEIEDYREENNQWSAVAEILIRNIGDKIEEELLKRRRQSEGKNMEIDVKNIDALLDQIAAKATDNNIYLSIKSVRNLKGELDNAEKRITEANDNRESLLTSLQETEARVKECELKMEELTNEYREYTKQ